MKKKELKRIIAGRLANIKEILLRILIATGEDVHKLRTNYKKLRSLIRLARRGPAAGKDMRLSADLKQLYHCAGDLRSLQLHYKHLEPLLATTTTWKTLLNGFKKLNWHCCSKASTLMPVPN